VPGKASHLSRTVYVYLPPQYFRASFSGYRFPVIELLPGFPGSPADWINVVGITSAFSTLLADGAPVKPAVLVMPDANGGRRISLQCLNVRHGPQDATYLAQDLPAYLLHILRVQPQGPARGIAGYSEGGFCSANLALVYRLRYGAAGVMSGYFAPSDDQLGNPVHTVNPFGTDLHTRRTNTPLLRIARLPVSARIPKFWLGVGGKDASGLRAARQFQRLVLARQPGVQLIVLPGGGHTMTTWRALVPSMLEWMTPLLTANAQRPTPVKQVGKPHASRKHHHRAKISQVARGSVRNAATPPA
jgi:enterochelin esterase-like enzyme